MHSVILEFLRLDLVVSVLVDFSEHSINVLVCNWEMNLVGSEELMQELSEFLSVQVAVLVYVELYEVLMYLLCEMVCHISEVSQSLQDGLQFLLCELVCLNHL